VTKPRGSNLDEDLSADRRRDIHILELEPAADGVENKSFHDREDALVPAEAPVKRCQGSVEAPSTTQGMH
jgi:hypothetical protein